MAGSDNVVINNLERATSSDINNLEAVAARAIADGWRQFFAPKANSSGFSPQDQSITDMVLGGLIATVAADNVSIDVSPGALMQESSTIVPTPGTYDSSYRVAINRGTLNIADPAPVTDTWYLLEAQMVEVTTVSATVDIYNPGTGLFVATPAQPKVRERQVSIRLRAGTATDAPLPTSNWVPLAIVFRPNTGGNILTSQIHDVRKLWEDRDEVAVPDSAYVTSWSMDAVSDGATVSNNIRLDVNAVINGVRLYAKTNAQINPTSAVYLSPGTVLSANQLYYLYLCPWSELTPRNYAINIVTNGVLVLSQVAPAEDGPVNSGAISLPSPFAAASVGAMEAVCVGGLLRNAANTGWYPQSCTRDGSHLLKNEDGFAFATVAADTDYDLDTSAGAGTPLIPAFAREVSFNFLVLAGAGADFTLEETGGGTVYRTLYANAVLENLQTSLPVAFNRAFFVDYDGVGSILRLLGWKY